MKRYFNISLMILLLALFGGSAAYAQPKGAGASESWSSARSIHLSGSPLVQLVLEPSLASTTAEDQDDTTQLIWGLGDSKSKITVSTFAPGQQYDLYVEALDADNAVSRGKVRLQDGMNDQNLLVNVKKNKIGSARLVYTASASIENGSSESGSSDVHTVTYTVTDM